MKVLRWINYILILAFLSSCGSSGTGGGGGFGGLFATPTPLPTAQATIISAPDAQAAVTKYLDAMLKDDYVGMYDMLNQASRDAITLEDFSSYYNDTLNNMSASGIEYSINSSLLSPRNAEVAYNIIYHTALVGDLQRNILMRLTLENGGWKVQWEDGLILPELAGGKRLAMDYSIPARGDIYDRDGLPIVSQADAFAFAIQTEQIDEDMRGALTSELGKLCGFDPLYIENQIDANGPGNYLAMCEGTRQEAQRLISISPGGLVYNEYKSRYYFETGLAPQAVGYTQLISPEQLNSYRRLGYNGSEKVGQSGIEQWAEDYLAGKHGGILNVVGPDGQIISALGQSNPQPADSVYLTLNSNMQAYAQKSIEFFRGAVVVMEVKTGRIIAMASAPDFDPNNFEPANPNAGGVNLLTDGSLLNRAAQGQYPLGSVFKIITMSAALESGLYLKDTTYDCQYDFTELAGYPALRDWTWQHCQDALAVGETCNSSSELPSGLLTLQEGLMRSCNPYFWHIGYDLFTNWQRGGDIAKMARAFGLGSKTGIEQIEESAGQILDPTDQISAVNQAIGQGDVQVTPLQVARFMSAIANGGTLYRPQIVEKIQPIDGSPVLTFKPEAQGTLPLRTENLTSLQEALLMVTNNPRGTARFNLRGFIEQYKVAGKTGTAESGNGKSHAWFAGYTLNEANTTLPDIAIVVIVENIGEGSEYAVPIFRAMAETYYYGSPQSVPAFGPIGQPPYTPTPFGGVGP
jgi:penicillin-binding protein 2